MTSTPKKTRGKTKPTGSSTSSAPRDSASTRSTPRGAKRNVSKSTSAQNGANGAGTANGVTVRVYRQGLGDCILVRMKRPNNDDYKLLIDCGLVLGAKNVTPTSLNGETPSAIMTSVVENLVVTTEGRVDVVAVTHEHWDHLSGFSQASASFAKLAVGQVWVAWTEDETDPLANELRRELGRGQDALTLCAGALRAAGDVDLLDVLADVALQPFGAAANGASTASIFKDIKSGRSFKGGKTEERLRKGRPTDAPIEIPGAGARIYALGPPHDGKLIRKINPSTSSPETYGLALNGDAILSRGVLAALAQFVRERGDEDKELSEEAAMFRATDSAIQDPEETAPFHRRVTIPLSKIQAAKGSEQSDARLGVTAFFESHYEHEDEAWRRIDADWLGAAPDLALAIQSYTNNTSLVLALEVGTVGQGDVFLFAADAQVGNWESWQNLQWTVGGVPVTGPDLLARTIFYKVGHHGSHNATLKAHGLEQMNKLKVAVFTVDENQAKAKHWDRMPQPELVDALKAKGVDVVILRTDQAPGDRYEHVSVDDLYFDISL